MASERVSWVDYAKGICIIFVVMMHSVHDYSVIVGADGWLGLVVAWAKPFRMPDFFLIAGLFLSRSLFGPRLDYFDRKVLHFAYFYGLWLGIQTLSFEADVLIQDPLRFLQIYAMAWIEPKSSLWFVHLLAVFYIVTRLVRNVPPLAIFLAAAAIQGIFAFGTIDTGWSVTNRFAEYYVFFFAGYAGARYIFDFAALMSNRLADAIAGLGIWAVVNAVFVSLGIATLPVVSLVLGFAGALAIIVSGVALTRVNWAGFIRYAGQNSIVIYLTFFIPMKILQQVFARTGLIPDIGTATLVILVASVASSLVFHRLIRNTPLNALYVRPEALRIRSRGTRRSTGLIPDGSAKLD